VNQGKLTDERILGLKGNSEIPSCVKCLVLEMRLKETIDELSSAQVIIDLLRSEMCIETEKLRRQYTNGIEHVNKTVDEQIEQLQTNKLWSEVVAGRNTYGGKEGPISKENPEPNLTSNGDQDPWKIVSKEQKNFISTNEDPHYQSLPYYQIPVITNRFEIPRNSETIEEMVWDSRRIHKSVNRNKSVTKTERNQNKQRKKIHKVMVIGDSHARGCAAELRVNLRKDHAIQGLVYPGAGINMISTSVGADIKQLSKQDVIIVWGGSRDVGKNESKQGINRLQGFIETNKHTNIILMEVPHRYDLMRESCVNKETQRFNNKLREYMEKYEHVTVLQVNMDRSNFTTHGQHMNKMGKELIAGRITVAIDCIVKKSKVKSQNKQKIDVDPEEAMKERRDSTVRINERTQVQKVNDGSQESKGLGRTTYGDGKEGDPTKTQNNSYQLKNCIEKIQNNEELGKKYDDSEGQEEIITSNNGSTLVGKSNNRNQANNSHETSMEGVREEGNSAESQLHNIPLTSSVTRGHILESREEVLDGNRENNVRENEIVEIEDVNIKKHENGIRTMELRRSRKTPATRSEDFLWTIDCKKHPR
jgi:hypothetical protein